MLSPAKPPLRAYAGFRRSRTEPAPHAAAARPGAQMVLFLADCRQRPWPPLCPCAGRPTPSEVDCASSSGGQPPGALQCAGAWPVCVTAGSAMPARTRRNQPIRAGSRHRNAAGSALSAFSGPSGRIRPTIPKALVSALYRRQGDESGRRPGCGHAHRRGCVPAYVCRRLLTRNARLQTRARGPASCQLPAKGAFRRPLRQRGDWRQNFGQKSTAIENAGKPHSRPTKTYTRADKTADSTNQTAPEPPATTTPALPTLTHTTQDTRRPQRTSRPGHAPQTQPRPHTSLGFLPAVDTVSPSRCSLGAHPLSFQWWRLLTFDVIIAVQ